MNSASPFRRSGGRVRSRSEGMAASDLMPEPPDLPDVVEGVSCTLPDISREEVSPWAWLPSRRLYRAIRCLRRGAAARRIRRRGLASLRGRRLPLLVCRDLCVHPVGDESRARPPDAAPERDRASPGRRGGPRLPHHAAGHHWNHQAGQRRSPVGGPRGCKCWGEDPRCGDDGPARTHRRQRGGAERRAAGWSGRWDPRAIRLIALCSGCHGDVVA